MSRFAVRNGKKSSWPVTGLWSRGPLKNLKDSKLILNESKIFPWSSRISLVPLRTFKGPLFQKPVTDQELFFALSYSKPALGYCFYFRILLLHSKILMWDLFIIFPIIRIAGPKAIRSTLYFFFLFEIPYARHYNPLLTRDFLEESSCLAHKLSVVLTALRNYTSRGL